MNVSNYHFYIKIQSVPPPQSVLPQNEPRISGFGHKKVGLNYVNALVARNMDNDVLSLELVNEDGGNDVCFARSKFAVELIKANVYPSRSACAEMSESEVSLTLLGGVSR